jgi:hypothetical protein
MCFSGVSNMGFADRSAEAFRESVYTSGNIDSCPLFKQIN